MESTARTLRGQHLHTPVVLAALALAGCPSDSDIVRGCFPLAPVCYLLGLLFLRKLRAAWHERIPDTLFRPWVLLTPVVGLALLMLRGALATPSAFQHLFLPLAFVHVLIPLVGGGLWALTLLLWRGWFSRAPRTSFEGAALAGCALFFAPWLPVFYSPQSRDFESLAYGILSFATFVGLGGVTALVLAAYFLWEARKSPK